MEKLNRTRIIALLVLSALYALIGQWIYMQSGIFIHRAIIWNVILAILPAMFIEFFFQAFNRHKKGIALLMLIIWLLLFPNVPYLMTDFIHISPLTFYLLTENGSYYLREVLPWLELSHIALGVWFGMMVGYRSLYRLQMFITHHYHARYAWLMSVLVSLLSGYGVFLGRFLRLNSWDILHPYSLIENIMENNDHFALNFTLFFSFFIFATYAIYYAMVHRKEQEHENIICK